MTTRKKQKTTTFDAQPYDVFFYIFLLLLLTTLGVYVHEKQRAYEIRMREGMNPLDMIMGLFQLIPQSIQILMQVGQMFASLMKALAKLPTFVEGLLTAWEGFFEEIILGLPTAAMILLPDFVKFFVATLIYGFHYIQCMFLLMNNFPQCFFWYALDIFCIILYLPVGLLVWITGTQAIEQRFWNIIYSLDKRFYLATGGHKTGTPPGECSGYHFAHYPCFVVNQCYRCVIDGKTYMNQAEHDKYINDAAPFISDLTPGSAVYSAILGPLGIMFQGLLQMISIFE